MSEKKSHLWRFMTVAVIFCVICMIYLGRLFYIQISGRSDSYDEETTVRRVTVQAVRGEIYDRNGNALVSNRYTYDLMLSYSTFSATKNLRGINEACLQMLEGLRQNPEEGKNLREERFFPMEGAYPYYSYSEDAVDGSSVIYHRLQRVLSDIGMEPDTSAQELMAHYVEKYDLLMVDTAGRRILDDDEIHSLICMYYDMDALRFRTSGEYTVAENVSLGAMTYVKELSTPLIDFYVNAERVYNYPGYASHILGTVGPIYAEEWSYYNEQGYQMNAIVGKSGCESAFEEYLHGKDGVMEIELDSKGNLIRSTVVEPAVAGRDVYLTIDIDLQIAAEDGLAENVQSIVDRANGYEELGAGCNAGAAVVLDPEDFSVLVLASYPSYDLNVYNLTYNSLVADEAKPLINRALNGLYEPGSTFKLGVAAAALTSGAVTPSEIITCSGKYLQYAPSYTPGCSTYPHENYGTRLTVRQAIADSCNVFFYEMGYRMGIDDLNKYVKRFGFGQKTGLELGGSVGALANPNNWPADSEAGMTLQYAIGQADTRVSPVQLACYISTLMQSGTRYSAHLLYGVGDARNGGITQYNTAAVLDDRPIAEWVINEIKGGMQQVVSDNNVVRSNLSRVTKVATVGGKTGTAQTGLAADNALFVCASPLESPDLVIAVVLEQGYGGSYASLTAARILEAYYGIES